ncbi:cytochrome c-type biogenesis protein CcmH [Bacillus sp. B-jedd]|uniref:cytochrome c-type biogenesis protein CcmH n=1 Tax=Bacillus sp. B-jedd TaxID=1476857 RepID=UPI0005157018|nr:cytochrome c-type biogenesis protein CcmH [Bacillus sp. B-jedd]CEG25597.1 Cytochrome C biogenesis protein [Bacillus sp. B-jedd]
MKRLMFMLSVLLLFSSQNVFADEEISHNTFDYGDPVFLETVNMLSMEEHGTHDYASCSVKQVYYQEVAGMFQQGMTKDEIIDYYLKNQGVQALNAPPKEGFNLTLWALPFTALFLFSFFIFLFIKKWKRNAAKGLSTGSANLDEMEEELYASLIDKERKKYL